MKPVRLTSLLLVEERLFEADYFIRRLRRSPPHELQYHLNAFLSAARSVTFLLQKEMAHVPKFREWLAVKREELREDAAARFFLQQRNFSQKEGRVRTVGFGSSSSRRRWTYRFIDGTHPVPPELYDRDIVDCCSHHVAKLARLTLEFADAFPFWSCPHRALTVEGLAALDVPLAELAAAVGFPDGWLDVAPPDIKGLLASLRTLVDAVDFAAIRKLSQPRRRTRITGGKDAAMQRLLLGNVEQGPDGYATIAAALLMGDFPSEERQGS